MKRSRSSPSRTTGGARVTGEPGSRTPSNVAGGVAGSASADAKTHLHRCAITGERRLPILEAAHIKPCTESGPHLVANGLLLRSDVHTLFDRGYVAVSDELSMNVRRVEVSKRIKEEFENGRKYYQYHGKPVAVLPRAEDERPAKDFLRWYQERVYLG